MPSIGIQIVKLEPVTWRVKQHSHACEPVKEPHFLDFQLCKIKNLQVRNCQF